MKILYVEDNPLDADLVRRRLSSTTPPHDVEIAPNIARALKRLQTPSQFELILLDLSLPDGNGLEVLTYIRRHKLPCAVVFLTGAEDLENAALAVKSGADDYVVKQGDYLQQLAARLDAVLRSFRDETIRKSQPLRVLYVEPDNVDVTLTIVHLARFAPHIHLESASDGESVLELLSCQDKAATLYDILLLADTLPGLSALDTFSLLHSRNGVDIPAVLLVSKGSEGIVSQVMRLGIDGFLSKQPFYLHQLPAALEGAFYRAEAGREHAALKASQQRYQDLVKRIPSGVFHFVVQPDGSMVFDYASPRFFEIFGLPPDAGLSDAGTAFSKAHPDDLSEIMRRIAATRHDLKALEWEGRFVIGGQVRWLRIESTATRLDNGDVVNDGIVKDITEHRLANFALRLRDKALEATANAIVITDFAGSILWSNSAFTLLTGYATAEVMGHNPCELVKSGMQDKAFYQNLWRTILAGQVWQGELINRRKDGTQYHEYQTITPVRDENGEISHFIAVKLDITERKQFEATLQQHQDQLKEIVAQRTADLTEARNQAEAATRAKSMFLANMSHEIRTPINAVIGMTNLALNTDLDRKQRDYLNKAQFAAELLLEVINDILDFSKIEAGKYELAHTEFKLDDVLSRVANVVGIRLKGKNIEFLLNVASDVPQYLVDDPLRLNQVLLNLCSNAVKFTHRGEIVVSISRLDNITPGQATLRFSVRDTGIGMSPEQQTGLFKPFSQVDDSSTRKYGGTGLGLVICKQLVGMKGGAIRVESVPGAGSEFSFVETFAIGNTESLSSSVSPAWGNDKARALVVDGSSSGRNIMSEMLDMLGFEVTSITDAWPKIKAELLPADNKHPFALVVLTAQMPACAGFDSARKIRLLPLNSPPKIVMVMAYGDCEVDLYSSREGFDGYLSKPATRSSLIETLTSVFGATPATGTVVPADDLLENAINQIRGCRVLVVEDNDLNQQIAYELLSDAGVIVTVADNGQEALDLVQIAHFDAVLMDVQMPVMDGYEATRLIRRDARRLSLPILAMTAHASRQDREVCLRAGMNDFITKPTSREALLKMLAKWITVAPPRENPETLPAKPHTEESTLFKQNIPGISLQAAFALYGQKPTFFLKLLNQFIQTRAASAVEIQAELTREHLDDARRIAHTMKSVGGAIGAEGVSRAAAALEKAIANQERETWDVLLDDFKNQLGEVVQGIRTSLPVLQDNLPSLPKTRPEKPMTEVLNNLFALLDVDVGRAVQLCDEIRPYFTSGQIGDEFRQFEAHLTVYDIAGAKASAARLIAQLDNADAAP